MLRHAALATSLTLTAITVTACGGDRDPSKQIEHVFRGWMTDFVQGHGKSACAHLTGGAQRRFTSHFPERLSCEQAVESVNDITEEDKREFPKTSFRVVHVDGDRAQVDDVDVNLPPSLRWLPPDDEPMVFRRIDGRWLIEDLG